MIEYSLFPRRFETVVTVPRSLYDALRPAPDCVQK